MGSIVVTVKERGKADRIETIALDQGEEPTVSDVKSGLMASGILRNSAGIAKLHRQKVTAGHYVIEKPGTSSSPSLFFYASLSFLAFLIICPYTSLRHRVS